MSSSDEMQIDFPDSEGFSDEKNRASDNASADNQSGSDSEVERNERKRHRSKDRRERRDSSTERERHKRQKLRRHEERKERKERKRKQREKRREEKAAAAAVAGVQKVTIVDNMHKSKPPLRVPPYEKRFVQELFPARGYYIRPGGMGARVYFDGLKIPQGFLGVITANPSLIQQHINVKCNPFFLLCDTQSTGFFLRFENCGVDTFHLSRERSCIDLRLIKLEAFFVRHLCMYSPEETRMLGVHPQYPPAPPPPTSSTTTSQRQSATQF